MIVPALTLLILAGMYEAVKRFFRPPVPEVSPFRPYGPSPHVYELRLRLRELENTYEELRAELAEEDTDEDDAEEVFFKPGEPQTLREFTAQPHITRKLQVQLAAAFSQGERVMAPQAFMGIAGLGKTLLARIIANELRTAALERGWPVGQFIEVFPSDIDSVEALDAVVRRAQQHPGSTIFIDEIHALEGTHALKLYEVLTNNRYKFRDEPNPVVLPPTQLLAATTDYGALHPALKRRWIKHFFRPVDAAELVAILQRRPFPIRPDAAELVVSRTKFSGAPWEALELYNLAVSIAQANGEPAVTTSHVEEVFALEQVDVHGLRWLDREVIRALLKQPKHLKDGTFVCHGASESNVCTIAGVDRDEYRQVIRPRLMSRRFLEMRPYYGQCLTSECVALYRSEFGSE